MKKILPGLIVLFIFMFVFTGCEDLFTTSAFEWAATDPADMTDSQLEEYAESSLGSGDTDSMAEAYTALSDSLDDTTAEDDPDLYLLATELALGGSGLTDVIVEVVPDVLSGGDDLEMDEEYYTELLDSLDQDMISESVDSFEAVAAAAEADDTIEITESQYTNAAIAQALVILDTVDGATEALTDPDADLGLTAEEEAALEEDVENVISWAEAGGVDLSTLVPDFDPDSWEF